MKENTIKIGIIGKIRSGKDTVADMLEKELWNYNTLSTYKTQFSEGIKDVIVNNFGVEVFENGKPREMYQDIGQLFRKHDGDIWIKKLFDRLDKREKTWERKRLSGKRGFNIIVKDIRQPNEAKALHERGYHLIKVTAPKEERVERAISENDDFSSLNMEHETEVLVDTCIFDYEIRNDGTLPGLERKVEKVFKEILDKGRKGVADNGS